MYVFDIVPADSVPRASFRVRAISRSHDKNDSEISRYLAGLKNSERLGFLALFQLYAESGTEMLSYSNFHCIDSNLKLYEFIKGRHRIVCFIDDETIVVCTHCFLKKTQKTPSEEKEKGERIRKRYLAAKSAGEIIAVLDD